MRRPLPGGSQPVIINVALVSFSCSVRSHTGQLFSRCTTELFVDICCVRAGDMIHLSPGESCIHFAVRHLQLEALEFLVNQPGANKALALQPCHQTVECLSHRSCSEVTICIHIILNTSGSALSAMMHPLSQVLRSCRAELLKLAVEACGVRVPQAVRVSDLEKKH